MAAVVSILVLVCAALIEYRLALVSATARSFADYFYYNL